MFSETATEMNKRNVAKDPQQIDYEILKVLSINFDGHQVVLICSSFLNQLFNHQKNVK